MKSQKTEISTGLSANQEKAVHLLLAGKSISQTAEQCNVDRGSIYNWLKSPVFEAAYNRLKTDIKISMHIAIWNLHFEALDTLRKSLTSKNEAIAFRAAIHILSELKNDKIGATRPQDIVRRQCTKSFLPDDLLNDFDEYSYQKKCRELGIEP